ncbi:MAG: preprotein translocase subunit SecE [Gomphosphaeria aponina SAG 52.96 = DSM 107014]|uniref:Protein translocase subunit SecE n=1 Tax=Gomphosphaeria aponina SAG 52.96 = DSM 107014 TaxID=1521640 RepID=A0A941JRH2_9CHRO|nr:preprotein translocase subunit SecE [Gomphosphaeria aponina SAG 52.96 = DSM 107014]
MVGKKDVATKEEKKETKEKTSEGLIGFTKETKQELEKVAWPSRQQLLGEAAAVILMVILVATVIYLVDNIFAWAAGMVF